MQDVGKAYNELKQGEPAIERLFNLTLFKSQVNFCGPVPVYLVLLISRLVSLTLVIRQFRVLAIAKRTRITFGYKLCGN